MARGPLATSSVLLLAAALAVPLGAQKAALVEVESERVRASDLAPVMPEWGALPPATVVLYAPRPGLARELPRVEFERLAARQGLEGIDAGGWPERIRLRRRERRLERAEAEAALATAVAARHRVSPEDVAVEIERYQPPLVPAGPLELRASAGGLSDHAVQVPVGWRTAEGRSGTLWLRARAAVRGVAAVARRRLEPGAVLGPQDAAFVEGELPAPPERWRAGSQQVLGRVLTRTVEAGQKIPPAALREKPDVEAGASLELRLDRGRLELRARARAEQPGKLGDRISVRNLASGRRVTARVVGPGRAEVVTEYASPGR